MRPRRERLLLVVAPTMAEAHQTARAFGIDPAICAGRLATRTSAHQLRGWSRGTPFIALNRQTWDRNAAARELDAALDALMRSGQLRIANERDLNEVRGEMVE